VTGEGQRTAGALAQPQWLPPAVTLSSSFSKKAKLAADQEALQLVTNPRACTSQNHPYI